MPTAITENTNTAALEQYGTKAYDKIQSSGCRYVTDHCQAVFTSSKNVT